MLTKLKPEFRIQPFDTLPSMILILLRISYGGQGGLRQDRQTEYRDRKSAQPLAAGATSLIEQETSASILIKALAMTNSKIPMSNECQSSKSKTFGIGAWDLIWHLNFGLWHSKPRANKATPLAGPV